MNEAVTIGRVAVKVVPDTSKFRREAKRELDAAERGLDPIEVEVSVSGVDAAREAREAVRAARTAVQRETLRLRLNLDDQADVHAGIKSIQRELRDLQRTNIKIAISEGDLTPHLERLREMRNQFESEQISSLQRRVALALERVTLPVGLDEREVAAAHTRLERLYHDIEERRVKIVPEMPPSERYRIQRQIDSLEGQVAVYLEELSFRTAQGRMALLARTRAAEIVPKVNAAAAAKAAATLAALSGARGVTQSVDNLASWVGGLDRSAMRIATTTTAVANLTAWLGAASSNALTFGASLGSISGAALAVPGLVGGMAIGLGATIAVLKDFNDVLPEAAGGLSRLQDSMSSRFWSSAEEPFRNFGSTIFPQFSRGLEGASAELGVFFGQLAKSGEGILDQQLDQMFADLGESISVAGSYTDSFVGAIEKLGSVGSGNLPRLADWFGSQMQDFDQWLESKGEVGLQLLVENGIAGLKDLGGILGATGGMFAGLARAAEGAGGSTLQSVRDTMEGVERIVNGADFQTSLSQAFRGFHLAMSEIADGSGEEFHDLMVRISDVSATALPSAGRSAGAAIGSIFDALDQPRVQRSAEGFFLSVEEMVGNLTPVMPEVALGFASVVDVIGDLGVSITGTLAPILSQASGLLSDVSGEVRPLISELGELGENVANLLGPAFDAAGGLISGTATALNAVVTPLRIVTDMLLVLPGPLTAVAKAIAGVALAAGGALFFGQLIQTRLTTASRYLQGIRTQAGVATAALNRLGVASQGIATRMGSAAGMAALASGLAAISISSQSADERVSGLGSTAGMALMGFAVGGPIGAALGAGAGLLTSVSQAGADLDAVMRDLGKTVDSSALTFEDRFKAIDEARNGFKESWGADADDLATSADRAAYALEKPFSAMKLGWQQLTTGTTEINEASREFERMEQWVERQQDVWEGWARNVSFVGDAAGLNLPRVGASLEDVNRAASDLQPVLEQLGIDVQNLGNTDWTAGDTAMVNMLDIMGLDPEKTRAAIESTKVDLQDVRNDVRDLLEYEQSSTGRNNGVADAIKGIGDGAALSTGDIENLQNALSELFNPMLDLESAVDEYYNSLAALGELDVAAGFSGLTEAGRINRDTTRSFVADVQTMLVAQAEAGEGADVLGTSLARAREQFINEGVAAGFSAEAMAERADAIGLTPDLVETVFRSVGIDETDAKIAGVKGTYDELAQKAAKTVKNMDASLNSLKPNMSPLRQAVRNAFDTAGADATSKGRSIGSNFAAGLRSGISASAALVADEARNMVSNAVRAANNAAQIRSPSRVMMKSGAWFAEGMAIGIQSMARVVVQAATDMTRHALYAANKQLEHMTSLTTYFNRAGEAYDNLLEKFTGTKRNQVGSMFGDDISRLSGAVRQAENVADVLRDAQASLSSLTSEVESFRAGIVDSFVASANPVTGGAKTFDGLIRGMEQARNRALEFSTSLTSLQNMGLDNETLRQLVEAGPEAALASVRALLAGGKDGIKQVADLQAEIAKAGAGVAGTAGDQIYGTALTAAQQHVKDLTKGLGALQHQIATYANSLLQAMASQLANPTITAALGNVRGVKELLAALQQANAAAAAPKAKVATTSPGTASTAAARAAAPTATVTNQTTVLHYYAAPGHSLDSEESLFDALSRARGA